MKKKIFILVLIIDILFLIQLLFSSYASYNKVVFVDRKTNRLVEEKIEGEKWLKFLYYSPYGKLSLNSLVKRKFLQDYYGYRMSSSRSKKKIEKFVKKYGINTDDNLLKLSEYKSFNEFFYRKLKKDARKIDKSVDSIVSPADSKLLVYQDVKNNDKFLVKGILFNLQNFLQDKTLASEYENASILIFRLAPTDYHRFHFPLDGYIENTKKVNGTYYSVSPLALKKNPRIFLENKREYSIIRCDSDVIMAEVGATMVGSIVQTYKKNSFVQKGDEKGYFKFGGSTVVLIFKKGSIEIDSDILKNSKNNLETRVLMGEKIAKKINNKEKKNVN